MYVTKSAWRVVLSAPCASAHLRYRSVIATIIAIAEKCDSSGIMKRSIMDSGISVVRSEDEPRAPGRYTHSLECNNVSQLNQVNREYEPMRVSTPKDCGMLPTQVKREMGVSPRDQGVDDLFIQGRQLCVHCLRSRSR